MQITELESYGFERSQAAKAISMCDGDVNKALMKLQEAVVSPILDRLWELDEEDAALYEKLKNLPSDGEEHEVSVAIDEDDAWGRSKAHQEDPNDPKPDGFTILHL